ncbi:hypothetical protein QJS04_geneDACA009335 [Acorus gramineus]|uniref:Protein EXORDIUM-like 2 n=1 Tax=Acorus gramineus TaxID=55184 RepID=A0AAV9AH73_ACOGR|nr:hypothetical protein QJS04_geneDACA009335 [Acorus gramineus]
MTTASLFSSAFTTLLFLLLVSPSSASTTSTRKLTALVQQQPLILKYHNGVLLKGNFTVNLIWYGKFTATQRSIISDFIRSLSPSSKTPRQSQPSVSSWWKTTERYEGGGPANLILGTQVLVNGGKSLKLSDLAGLASRGPSKNAINVVLTGADVTVEGFCMSRCGTHGASPPSKKGRFAYVWVGNSATQCPGQCAWPFHQPIYGPQGPPLVAPNNDVGVDGMVINLATLLAGTVTNPFDGGYYQGPATAPLEAVSACTGIFGKGAYPGYPGRVLVDRASGASYNAQGMFGRKYLLPAMWDPKTSQCATLV